MKANNKYMKNYDKNIESSYLAYLDANNLYGWAVSQKLPVYGFEWVEKSRLSRFNKTFIKKYNENSDIGYFLEVDIDYPKDLFNLHKEFPFLPERKKLINVKNLFVVQKTKKICCSYKSFKTSIKSWINTKKVHRVIKFNQRAWLKPYVNMNTKRRIKANNEFVKYF